MVEFSQHLVIISLVLSITLRTKATDAGVNAGEFRAMCKFIRTLKAPPRLPEINLGGKSLRPDQLAKSALNRVGELVVATTDEQTFSRLTKNVPQEANNSPTTDGLLKDEVEQLSLQWKLGEQATGDSSRNLARPPPGPYREKAHRRIVKIYREARGINTKIENLEQKIRGLAFQARKWQFSALYGAKTVEAKIKGASSEEESDRLELLKKTEITGETYAGQGASIHDKICGSGSSPTENTGYSIVADLTCLCAQASSPNSENYCGAHTRINGGGDYQSAINVVKLGKEIVAGCGEQEPKPDEFSSPEKLMSIVSRLHGMLGKNVLNEGASSMGGQGGYRAKSQFILGAHSVLQNGAAKCNGAATWGTAGNGICVDYAHHLQKGEEIPWIKSVIAAAEMLRYAEGNLSMLAPLVSQIQGLQNSAEIYYEDALDSQKPTPNALTSIAKAGEETTKVPLTSTEKGELNSGNSAEHGTTLAPSIILLLLMAI